MSSLNVNELLVQSFQQEQLGQFSNALDGYKRVLEGQPDHPFAVTRYLRLLRDMRTEKLAAIKIVWQIDPAKDYWETDWMRYLLSGLTCSELVDGRHAELHDGSIIVDNRMSAQSGPYYFELLKRGHRFAIVHLSDEGYSDDCGAYAFANVVLRNYWSRAHAADKAILSVPLGITNGFEVKARKATRGRPLVWCFVGNANKSSRTEMHEAMSAVKGGFFHGTNRVGPLPAGTPASGDPQAPLTVVEYCRLMSDAIFAPCPAGWENLDSFRVCEALEAGCIPIVERRPAFDYFRHLFGEHPMITIEKWGDAPALIRELSSDAIRLDERRLACANWWQSYKQSLVGNVRDRITRSFAGAA